MMMFDLNKELEKIKNGVDKDELGMILVHNGIVRGTSRKVDGRVISMQLDYDKNRLDKAVKDTLDRQGVKSVVVYINEGLLKVGDDIMYVIVAGDRRANILSPFIELIEQIKTNVVTETEAAV